ncbi:adenylate kinase family enzyme [Labedella gwakjiensis]|uniref:AAA family ATPase n=1 Tax=Labedella gwakjiensis TaxID=390269 RepID=A0A2P8H052_9MICO|nr:AAA family ATPase [Labedella gwakjiensis]PSL39593.1 adenylate kinase family enzyme [Labedella gwakjiensis]RUQ86013.1 AAA family ATPase [Labedella gwakjiensis]
MVDREQQNDPSPVEPRLPRRILVAGSSGAGKTTLAAALASRLSLPYTELDSLFHGPSWTPRESFVADVTAIAHADAWVSEWSYSSARPVLLDRAELFIGLDYSRAVVMARVIRRTLVRRWARIELWNGNREPALRTVFTDPEHVVRWSWSTFTRNRKLIRSVAAAPPPGLDVILLRSPRCTQAWLDGFAG